jgi:hypothetical protein
MCLFWRYRVGLLSMALGFSATVTAAAQDVGTPALDPVMLRQGMTMNAAIRAADSRQRSGTHPLRADRRRVEAPNRGSAGRLAGGH